MQSNHVGIGFRNSERADYSYLQIPVGDVDPHIVTDFGFPDAAPVAPK